MTNNKKFADNCFSSYLCTIAGKFSIIEIIQKKGSPDRLKNIINSFKEIKYPTSRGFKLKKKEILDNLKK